MRIEAALTSIFKQSHPGHEVQVVLVDNNCSDNTVKVAQAVAHQFNRTLLIVQQPTPGLIYARQAGALAATGSFVCFVDDDNILDPGYLYRAREVFSNHPEVGYIGGISRLPSNYILPGWLTDGLLLSYAVGRQHPANGPLNSSTPLLWGAGLCVRRTALQRALRDIESFRCVGRVGGKQLAGDDSELCYRLALEGWSGFHDDSLCLIHAIDPDRFTKQRVLDMHEGFGSAKPILDSLEAALAKKGSQKTTSRRAVLYTRPGRLAVYSLLAALWTLRASGNVTGLAKATYYRAALRTSLRSMLPRR